jgi:transposase-like protein
LISELKASGAPAVRFAREHGIALASLYYWQKKLKSQASSSSALSSDRRGTFAEVVVLPRASSSVSRIEVVTQRGRTIRIEGAVDVALLRDVLRVVESC